MGVVRGVVIDAAAVAAGTVCAEKARRMAEEILSDHREKLMCVTPGLKPGHRYLSVNGGLTEGAVTIQEMTVRDFAKLKLPIKSVKKLIIATSPTTAVNTKEVATTVTVRDQKEHRLRNQKERSVDQNAISKSLAETHQEEKEEKKLLELALNLSLAEKNRELEEEQKLQQVLKESLRESMIESQEEQQFRQVAELSRLEFEQRNTNNRAFDFTKYNRPSNTMSGVSQVRHDLIEVELF